MKVAATGSLFAGLACLTALLPGIPRFVETKDCLTHTLAKQCEARAEKLKPFIDHYGEEKLEESEHLYHQVFDQTRTCTL